MKQMPISVAQAITALCGGIAIPSATKYIAQDNDGEWWWYEFEPYLSANDLYWVAPDEHDPLCEGAPPEDYTQEVYEIIY